jgi:hypothetical protein
LKGALDEMPLITWADACTRSITIVDDFISQLGDFEDGRALKNGRTIMRWLQSFWSNSESFPNPRYVWHGKIVLPQLLDNYPTFKNSLVKEMDTNLAHLTGEFVHRYVMDNGLPAIMKERRKELDGDTTFTTKDLLNENGLTKISLSTIYRWMDTLGYKYNERKKCYYVDNHESDENVAYRNEFLSRYFTYELRSHRWIQIPLGESVEMENKGEVSVNCGYRYEKIDENENELTMVEYHVDDCILFQDRMNNNPFGGHLSVRKPKELKPLFMFG